MLQELNQMLVNPNTIKECKVSRQRFYACDLTSKISQRNIALVKLLGFSTISLIFINFILKCSI